MRPLRPLVLALAALLVAPVVAAEARTYDVERVLRPHVERVAAQTAVPIRLPATLDLDHRGRAFGDGARTARGYSFALAAVRRCANATACFLARFTAQRRGRLSLPRRVRLARGIAGRFKPLTCGASCSPPAIEWRQRRVRYAIQAKVAGGGRAGDRRELVRAANAAIRSVPR